MKRLNRARKYRRRRRILYTVILLITAGVIALGFNFKRFQNEYDWLTLKPEQKLNVPLENQLPDLPNGCEVTSLSMLLKYYDINVSKLELSSNIKHVSSFVGNNYRGNPHVGFVGYMSIKNAGWCVYNEPLYNVWYTSPKYGLLFSKFEPKIDSLRHLSFIINPGSKIFSFSKQEMNSFIALASLSSNGVFAFSI